MSSEKEKKYDGRAGGGINDPHQTCKKTSTNENLGLSHYADGWLYTPKTLL